MHKLIVRLQYSIYRWQMKRALRLLRKANFVAAESPQLAAEGLLDMVELIAEGKVADDDDHCIASCLGTLLASIDDYIEDAS